MAVNLQASLKTVLHIHRKVISYHLIEDHKITLLALDVNFRIGVCQNAFRFSLPNTQWLMRVY